MLQLKAEQCKFIDVSICILLGRLNWKTKYEDSVFSRHNTNHSSQTVNSCMSLLTQELGNSNSIHHLSHHHTSLKQMTDKQETETQEAL